MRGGPPTVDCPKKACLSRLRFASFSSSILTKPPPPNGPGRATDMAKTDAPPGGRRSPQGKVPVPYDGTIRLVGHRVREVQPGVVQVEARITCEGRTFSGAVAGPVAPPDRLSLPAIATLRALDACLQIFYLGLSHPTLVLDNVVEVSVGDLPVAVVMVTASEGPNSTSVVAAAPLVGSPDPAVILATLQATSRIVSHWLTWGDRFLPPGEQDRPQ